MITFGEVAETNKEINSINNYIQKLNKHNTFYSEKYTIDRYLMSTMNTLLGKYFNGTKKVSLKKKQTKDSYSRTIDIQMNKRGLGVVSGYGSNMDLFNSLFKSYYSKGFIQELLGNKDTIDKVKSHLKDNGKDILDLFIKNLEENPLQPIEQANLSYEIKITPEEAKVFNIKKDVLYIKIYDTENDLEIYVSRKGEMDRGDDRFSSGSDDNKSLFSLSEVEGKGDVDMFIKLLFIHNHKQDFDNAIKAYEDTAKPEHEKWKKFEKKFSEDTAKYTMLALI